MRSATLILLSGACAIAVQGSLLRFVWGGSVVPDFILVLSVYLGLYHQRVGGAVAAFFLGYLLDTFSGAPLGENAFAMTLVFVLVYLLSRRVWIEGGLPIAMVVLAAAVAKTVVVTGLAAVFATDLPARSIRADLSGGMLAAVLSPFVFRLLAGGRRWLGVSWTRSRVHGE
jgi:rod shape-determining protein MreD